MSTAHRSNNYSHNRRYEPRHEVEVERVEKVARPAQVQPDPIKFEGDTGRYYETKRNGRVSRVWLVAVKKDKVIIKDDPTDAHSRELSLAKFVKFYA